jgi:excisionase family DNA binding protein
MDFYQDTITTALKELIREVLLEEGILPLDREEPCSKAMEAYLNTFQAGRILKKSHKYVAKLIRIGKIAAKKIGGEWLIHQDDLNNFLMSKKTTKTNKYD